MSDEIGEATSRGYCCACPVPIEVGDMWRRERVGNTVPHSFHLVHHPECPPLKPTEHVHWWMRTDDGRYKCVREDCGLKSDKPFVEAEGA
jgi:hypothetical protein